MARQLHLPRRDTLIIGDSNIRRNLSRAGKLYAQTTDCGLARNLAEFTAVCQQLEPGKYKAVIFAMMTNILVSAGDTGYDHPTRMTAISECLGPLIRNIRLVVYLLFHQFCP
jgi:hypothetical protein